jgi:hypothetical protein
MCSAMACPELKTPPAGQEQLAQLRQRIITMFFKSLTSRNADVVDLAKRGLKRVIQQQSLSKELLQSSLRPILVNLAHYKNLTMPLLVGLERLLELLSNWFNPTLGEKLLEHLRRWLEPDAQKNAGQPPQQARAPPKDFKIAAAMINLFHLLPQAAGKFLEPLVMLTMQLEQALPQSGVHSEVNSLYRKPLAKFLGRYAADAVDFFLARLNQPAFFFRLLDMVRMEKEGAPIREELCKSSAKIVAAAFAWPRARRRRRRVDGGPERRRRRVGPRVVQRLETRLGAREARPGLAQLAARNRGRAVGALEVGGALGAPEARGAFGAPRAPRDEAPREVLHERRDEGPKQDRVPVRRAVRLRHAHVRGLHVPD